MFESPLAYERFVENSHQRHSCQYKTCGTGALSLLTGISPVTIETKLPPSQKHWSDKALTDFLKRKRFQVVPVSKYGVTNIDPDGNDWEEFPLNENHVLVCNLLMCRNEASWWVITRNRTFHNFEEGNLNPLTFINKPSQSMYLVTHKTWLQ